MVTGMHASPKLKPLQPAPRPLPLGHALGLGSVVLLAHLWLLSAAPLPLAAADLPASAVTQIRLHLPAIPATGASAVPATPAAVPANRPPAPASRAGADAGGDPAASQAATGVEAVAAPAEPALQMPPQAGMQPELEPDMKWAQATGRPTGRQAPAAEPAQAAAAPRVPGAVRLRYAISGQLRSLPYSADGELIWQHDGQRYEARMTLSGMLLARTRVMASVGELGPLGLAPRRFSDKSRSEQATHFQPERGRILFSSNAPEAPWQPGAQDRVSLFFQLAGLLAAEPGRYRPGAQLRLLVAGNREADTWTFTVTGTPNLELPAGPQATVALRREPRREHDQTIEIWLAPALGYLPARIRITQGNGDVVDQRLAALEPL